MNASPERLTALKASSTHLGAFPDTEKDRDGVECISGMQQAVSSSDNLNNTSWDTHECTS